MDNSNLFVEICGASNSVSCLILLCIALIVIIIFLTVKIIFMKRTVSEITDQFAEKLKSDTNTLITVSSYDKTMRDLASKINTQLKELKKQTHHFVQGNLELKNTMTNISHDLRTPLTAISGYLELLDECEKNETLARYTEIIKNRTNALIKLTDELFDYLVATSSELDIMEEPVDIRAVLEENIIAFYAAFEENKIMPEITLPKEKIMRNTDLHAWSRIFTNIISNAIKYSDGDLKIEMTDDGAVTFSNTASNLNGVEVERLFDRYYTVESAGKSTGLGLSIAKALIERVSGSISAKYDDGRLYIYILLSQK